MKVDRSFFLQENRTPKRVGLITYLTRIPINQREKEVTRLAERGRLLEEDVLGKKIYWVIEERA